MKPVLLTQYYIIDRFYLEWFGKKLVHNAITEKNLKVVKKKKKKKANRLKKERSDSVTLTHKYGRIISKGDNSNHYIRREKSPSQPVEKTAN